MKQKKFSLGKLMAMQEFTVFLLVLIVFVLLSVTRTSVFLSSSNLLSTLMGMATQGILAIGVSTALMGGCFDMSVGSTMGMSAMVCALFCTSGINPWISALLALIIAAAFGTVNGLMVGYIGLNPFIATLGTMSVGRGIVSVLTLGMPVSILNVENINSFRFIGAGSVGGVPMLAIILVVFVAAAEFVHRKSSAVMKVRYVGSNFNAAYLSGINVKKTKLFLYITTGLSAGMAGILSLARFGSATNTLGTGIEMDIICGAVIGGISMAGGIGSVIGAVLGVLLMNLISNALVLFRVSAYWQELITGVITVLAVLMDLMIHSRPVKNAKAPKEAAVAKK